MAGAHPRSRGEHKAGGTEYGPTKGSSPLTRGAHAGAVTEHEVFRLIPAHAGSTADDTNHADDDWAHPRSRGEHLPVYLADAPAWGSSPLTRGAPHASTPPTAFQRLIPAHAGSTASVRIAFVSFAAHPRSRGEHYLDVDYERDGDGSSPLTRGARNHGRNALSLGGLIPAHAGSTRQSHPARQPGGAHPRSRGEHSTWNTPVPRFGGSSPLTRGAREPRRRGDSHVGLIPAHAGSTRLRQLGNRQTGAHPRSRGEHVRSHLTTPG